MTYNITLIATDSEGDIVCQVEAYTIEEITAQLRKVEQAIARRSYEAEHGFRLQ